MKKTLTTIILMVVVLVGVITYFYINKQSIKPKIQHKKFISKKVKTTVSNNPLGTNIYICDSKNNRIIEVNPQKQIIWQMTGIKDPDDVQVYKQNRLIVNEEKYSKVIEINTQTKKIIWSYGHLGIPSVQPGYLGKYVDDSFKLPNGNVLITDAANMRIIEINKLHQIVWQYGVTGIQSNSLGFLNAPNDAMPQVNSSILITNIGNHKAIDINPNTKAIQWSVNIPESYPSDILVLPNGNLLSTDWVYPGKIQEITKNGGVIWTYQPTGVNTLNHPSSTQLLPNGNYLVVDDHNDRIFVLNPKTKQIVWQYGITGQAGIGFNMLNDPSGVALSIPMESPVFVTLTNHE